MTDFGTALMKLWPNGDKKVSGLRAGIIESAPSIFAKYGITSQLVLAHLMAQVSHECGAGNDVVENLNYKTAEQIKKTWPSRFPTLASAQAYVLNPRALANKVYNGVKPDGSDRMGNRPGTDDGWYFRGRGGSQTTGREGYERVKKQTGFDVVNNPDILIDPRHFLECAVSDFINCGCMPYAKADDVLNVTKKLNGGTIGLADRKVWLKKWKDASVPVPAAAGLNERLIAGDLAVATPSSSSPPTLRKGDKGEDVATMQRRLNANSAVLIEDGDFGKVTETALKTFQSARGLVADAVCGPTTWAALLK